MKWAGKWGYGSLWGSGASKSQGTQGFIPKAKPDTVFLGLGDDFSALSVDLSQSASDLTDATTYAHRASDTICALSDDRCVEVEFQISNSSGTGLATIVTHGTQWRIMIDQDAGDGELLIILDTGTEQAIPLPGWGASEDEYVVAWSTEPNPYKTGASDALRSEVALWNKTQEEYSKTAWVHAANGTSSADFVVGAADTSGTQTFAGTITAVRIGDRFHPPEEAYYDWIVDEPAAEWTPLEALRLEQPVPEKASRPDADDGAFAGPVLAQCAAAVRQNDLLLASPLVNWEDEAAPAMNIALFASKPSWNIDAPGSGDARLWLGFLRRRPISPAYNAAKVRACVRMTNTVTPPDTLHVYCYSMSRIPGQLGFVQDPEDETPFDFRYVTASVSANHGSSERAWLDFGTHLPLVGDGYGYTYLCLAFLVEDTSESESTGNNSWRVQAWNVEPVLTRGADTGLPGGLGLSG